MKGKILYLLHTDWNWIKQRSQFLAEKLNDKDCEVHVVYKYSLRRKKLVSNVTLLKIKGLLFCPFSIRPIKLLSFVDRSIWRSFFRIFIFFHRFNKIIVTHPLLIDYVKDMNVPIIYDCHDDNSEFYSDGKLKLILKKKQNETLRCASQVVFSSQYLFSKFSVDRKNSIVRNGHNCSISFLNKGISKYQENTKIEFNVVYFGTISNWFDDDLLVNLLDRIPDLRFTIIGPSDVEIKKHQRISYLGAMQHEELIKFSETADGFIMPFKLNELIYGVDPVKIYEYLSYPVPVISIYYPELDHFSKHVEFYKSDEEAFNLFSNLINNPNDLRIDIQERINFLQNSSWSTRACQFKKAIFK